MSSDEHPRTDWSPRPDRWLLSVRTDQPDDVPYAQGTLALSYSLPTGLDAIPRGARLRIADERDQAAALPDPRAWASRFLQAVVEVVSSDRPLPQLARWTEAGVYAEIGRIQRATATRRRGAAGRPVRQYVASVHVFRPDPAIAEVAARIHAGVRSRALAARLDFDRQRWTCTALHFG